ncbi:hypothetical protein [Granulicella sp. S156]|uniref:hypothetical protein n=1 Tax=Granulicella sp. S156 TaxID=1747224 RepID=UPI00131D429B|nr:hypothetical protein [Granulicella sp. S156]
MHIPYPERIPYAWATTFASVLFAVQLFERTQLLFALCCFAFILVATAAFNIAGGLYRPAGAYIFFNAVLTLVVGVVVKAVLGEPADTFLASPQLTIEIYLFGMLAMLFGAYVESRFRPRKSFIEAKLPMPNLRTIYFGATAIALFLKLIYMLAGIGLITGSSFITTVYNADHFLPFALILGVIYTIRATGGQRSVTPWLVFLFGISTAEGLLIFSKQALFSPAVCWILGAAISRYRLKPINIISLIIVVYVAYAYATPYSQYGRVLQEGSELGNARIAGYLLTHMDEVIKGNAEQNESIYGKLGYYRHSMGLFDRLQMLTPDDALITVTGMYGVYGLEPLKEDIENVVPHIFWPDKPIPYFGNVYGHEIGAITDEDVSTSISFGASADAYHEDGLAGVLLIEPLCMAAVFLIFSCFLGDARQHPAVIVAILMCAHSAPEGSLTGLFGMVTTTEYMILLALACKYVLPLVGSIFDFGSDVPSPAKPAFGMN